MTPSATLRLTILIAFIWLLGWQPARAQDARDTVAAQLKVVTDVKADEQFVPDQGPLGRATLFGVLEHDTSVYLEVTLQADREYFIAARCDSGCSNLDTRLLGPDYASIADDTLDNDAPKMQLTPVASGPHLLAVKMTTCAERICYFGLTLLSRPAR